MTPPPSATSHDACKAAHRGVVMYQVNVGVSMRAACSSSPNEAAHNSTVRQRVAGVGRGDAASSLPDDTRGLSRGAETWSPFREPRCDSQRVAGERHWKSMSLCSLIVGKKLPSLRRHIIGQGGATFIYLDFFLSSSFSTLSPLWDVLAG